MKKENIFRKEFEEVQNNDVYVYYQDRNMDSSLIIGFSQNYVEFLEKKVEELIISAFENGRYNANLQKPDADITGKEYYKKEFLNK